MRGRFVVVGMVGCGLVTTGTGTQLTNPKLSHHILMVLDGGPVIGLGYRRRRLLAENASSCESHDEHRKDVSRRSSRLTLYRLHGSPFSRSLLQKVYC